MSTSSPSASGLLAMALSGLLASCGGGAQTATQPTPPTPVTPSVSVTAVQVGIAGDKSGTLAPGETRQLFAVASSSDGTTADVSNVALWQSSNPVAATVTSGGLVTAAAIGEVDVTATYQNRSGSVHAEVKKPGCVATVSPPSLTYSAFGGSTTVQVDLTQSDCRWTVKSDAGWLPLSIDPNKSGSGYFSYSIPANSTTAPRQANLIVSVAGGPVAVHAVTQERPVSCSYVVTPAQLTIAATGGAGAFDVITTPGDCQWTVYNSGESGLVKVSLTGPRSGTGAARITYSTAPNPYSFDVSYTIEIRGLSGLNPPGTHTVTILRQ
jgi:hypothetical protein